MVGYDFKGMFCGVVTLSGFATLIPESKLSLANPLNPTYKSRNQFPRICQAQSDITKNTVTSFSLWPLTSPNLFPYFPAMEQFFLCACCGEENDITIDQLEGDNQEFVQDCSVCCRPNVILAKFNYHSNEFDLEVYQEDVG